MIYNAEGKLKVERLKVRWIVVLNNDLRMAGVRNWRTEAEDRDGWETSLEEAEVQLGL